MNRSLLLATVWYHLRRLGWPGLAGAALLGGALLVHGLITLPEQAQADALRTRLDARRSVVPSPQQVLVSQQSRVLAALPGADGGPAAIKTIHAAAIAHGLEVQRAEYRLVREASVSWTRYQMTIPVRAEYARVRSWLDEILEALPSMALDEIQLRRDDASEGTVEARVRLTLFLRAAP